MAILTPSQTYLVAVIGGLTVLIGGALLAFLGWAMTRLAPRIADACEVHRARRRLKTCNTIDDLKE